jgi:DNA (cytosine-5)-methyltransferase 1
MPLKKIDYIPFLESCWQEHLLPKADNAPTVISTFAGCGGSSLGYSMAGFRELLAIEWDDNAVETFKLNFPNVPVYHGDIAKISIDKVLELIGGLKPGELDIFDGSPPCQGFSTAGKREFSDDRNQLFREYARLLRGLKPKVFVMENVSGMVKGVMKLAFVEILKELKASGYKVSARLLNAMYFNVPQSRQRMIFIGVRDDLGIDPSHPGGESLPIYPREVLTYSIDFEDRRLPDVLLKYAKIHPLSWNTDINLYKSVKGNTAGGISLKWCQLDMICGTIPKQEISLTGVVHPNRQRYLNLSEAQRLTSFPNLFKFTDRKNGWSRIGNSVPPLFMRSIARHIKNNILDLSKFSESLK